MHLSIYSQFLCLHCFTIIIPLCFHSWIQMQYFPAFKSIIECAIIMNKLIRIVVGVVWKFPMNNIVSLKIQKYFWIKRVFVPEMAWPIQNIAFELCSFEERKKNTCSFFLWKKTKILRADTHNYAAKSMERMRKVFVDLITNCLVSSSDIVYWWCKSKNTQKQPADEDPNQKSLPSVLWWI